MKKKCLFVLLLTLTTFLIFGLSACKEEHTHSYVEKITKPTCTEQGITTYTCQCGDNYDVYTQQLGHTYNCEVATSKYLKSNATCTSKAVYYKSCSCGKAGTSTFESGSMKSHTYNCEVATSKYLKSNATCTSKAVYYKSCACGKANTSTFESGEFDNHSYLNGICSICQDNTVDFYGGNGSLKYPYLISTKTHLNNIRYYTDSNFKLINDIIFTSSDFAKNGAFYNNASGWSIIGSFSGCIDGDFYEIKNLYTKNSSFIGKNEGTIRNLNITNANIKAIKYLEDTAGRTVTAYASGFTNNNYGLIEYCHISGSVYCENKAEGYVKAYAAGLVGQNFDGGIIRYCYNEASVMAKSICTNEQSSDAYAGGICANNGSSNYSKGALIENCYNVGKVSSISEATNYCYEFRVYLGGICAINHDWAKINYCFNLGDLIDDVNYGKWVSGAKEYTSKSGITINKSSGYYFNGSSSNCYCLPKYSTDNYDSSAIICTKEEMAQQGTFVGFDFNEIWKMGTAHPTLKGFKN